MFSITSLAELTSHPSIATDDPALLDGTDMLTYGELDDLTGRIATALIELGVEPGDRVGVYLKKSVWSFATVHAVMRAGGVMVPVDPFAPSAHVVSVLTDAGVRHLVTDARASTVAEVAVAAELDGVISRSSKPIDLSARRGAECIEWSELDGLAAAEPIRRKPDDDAYIIYTSGSTGRPKGIVHTHASALAYARIAAAEYAIDSSDRLANIAGLHFDQSTFELYVAPLVGASVLVVPDAVLKFPASLSELAERSSVTVWYSVPYVLRHLVDRGALDQRDLSSIRLVLYGGESYPPDELAHLMNALPDAIVSNVYGPAEVNQCTRHDLDTPPAAGSSVPIGGPWPETHLLVVDVDDVPTDGVGELLVATSTMMDRYWNRPDLTAAAVVHRRGADGVERRWYRTGDLVELDADGALVFLGRSDNQVKIRGQRVELEAVDATVRSVDGVAEVACVVARDEREESGVVAVVESEPGVTIASADVIAAVRARHSAVAVPTRVVQVERLERTGTGKIDRNAAQSHLAP